MIPPHHRNHRGIEDGSALSSPETTNNWDTMGGNIDGATNGATTEVKNSTKNSKVSGLVSDANGGALILAYEIPKLMISERMGSEVLTLLIGEQPHAVPYTVHKNLLRDCGGIFKEMCDNTAPSATVALKTENPEVFKLFIDYIYSDTAPAVAVNALPAVKATKLYQLVQFYAFIDKYNLYSEIRDRTMDNIQDGFYIVQKFPEGPMIQAVYQHSRSDSKLRQFCAASMVYQLQSQNYVHDGVIPGLINTIDELMVDFLEAIRSYAPHQDPRIRHCRGKEGCAECAINGGAYLAELDGVEPCRFHIHPDIKVEEDGTPVCHLWYRV